MATTVDHPGTARTASTGNVVARLRTTSGLILFSYVLSHLLNHAAGIWSLEALAYFREPFVQVWRNPIGTSLLYGALTIHILIALRAIWLRDSFRAMSWSEIAQLSLGLSIPLLLVDHAIATRYASAAFGVNDDYTGVVTLTCLRLRVQ
ncbi:adenylate cyclase protein [alpha proteobacterium BAL199]|nr:adenylate cyclase protein [alpha proteobacterium BAL199]